MTLSNKNILVTGGAGFIGSELSRQAVAAGARVTVVDNLVNGKSENLADIAGDLDFQRVDIRDVETMRGLMQGADIVYHLACLGVRHSLHSPRENHDVNATATLDLLAAARDLGVPRFVYVSSSEVYGTARWAPMTEEHPTYPMTVYGGGKLAGECYARAYWESYDYPAVVIRPFNAFGPRSHHEGDSGEVIPKFVLRAMAGKPLLVFGDGTQTRDFTYVGDTARGILLGGTSDKAVGQTINIGSGHEITVNDLAETVSKLVADGKAAIEWRDPRPGDVLRLYSDPTRGRDLLGYQSSVSLDQGLQHLIDWYRTLGVTPESLLEHEREQNWIAA
ncbi:MAG: NAD-dependent epimerase/dehydratase family protein [Sphingomonas sp.]|uniref:NAD-dependent epimerase/dehydratase family protein n=1 Tax=Sphingomonas sp. TaxID=28214 RepID=UPI003F808AA0